MERGNSQVDVKCDSVEPGLLSPSPDTRHPTPHTRSYSPWLHRFAIAFVLATFILIVLGGTVTSKGAGLAVPDWPTTFNYNMFLFPPSMWVGGIFWEHSHRLMGSLVGLMAIVMCIWLWQTNSDPTSAESRGQSPRTPVRGSIRPWLKHLGVATLIMVIIQGIMGGLRVTQLSTWLAVFHGITAQLFLCMTVLIAAATSRWWITGESRKAAQQRSEKREDHSASAISNPKSEIQNPKSLHRLAHSALMAIFIQLALGATMRHHGAGLAIPDFPLSYGKLVPPLSQPEIENAMIAFADNPESYASTVHGWYSPFQVAIHWAHRLWAIMVIGAVVHLIVKVLRTASHEKKFKAPAIAIGIMLLMQIALGATTIWTGRHPEVATAHQTLGAILLATTALLYFRIRHIVWHDQGGKLLSNQPQADAVQRESRSILPSLQAEGAGT